MRTRHGHDYLVDHYLLSGSGIEHGLGSLFPSTNSSPKPTIPQSINSRSSTKASYST